MFDESIRFFLIFSKNLKKSAKKYLTYSYAWDKMRISQAAEG